LAAVPATLAVALGWLYSFSARNTVPEAAKAMADAVLSSTAATKIGNDFMCLFSFVTAELYGLPGDGASDIDGVKMRR
jgi:hypothetical protein